MGEVEVTQVLLSKEIAFDEYPECLTGRSSNKGQKAGQLPSIAPCPLPLY
jgi:hypothetical protein